MAKFKKLEEIQTTIEDNSTASPSTSTPSALTEAQLVEVFEATADNSLEELMLLEMMADWESDVIDDCEMGDEEWDEADGVSEHHKSRSTFRGSRTRLTKQQLLARYKALEGGELRSNHLKRTALTFLEPLKAQLIPWTAPDQEAEHTLLHSQYRELDVFKTDVSSLGNSIQALYLNPWLNGQSGIVVDFEAFAKLTLPMAEFILLWVPKLYMPAVMNLMPKRDYRYVENISWIRLDAEGQIDSKATSGHETCFIFRSNKGETALELRHQRNADCVFTDVHSAGVPDDYIYHVIETLLPTAKAESGSLIHL